MTQGAVGRSPVVRVAAPPAERPDREPAAYEAAREAAGSVPVVRTGPVGVRAWEPLVLLTRDGRTAAFGAPTARAVREAVGTLADGDGDLPTDGADAVVDHEPGARDLPVREGPLAVGRRRVLAPLGWRDPLAPDDWPAVSTGDAGAEADVDALAGCRVRGRGWGDAADGDPVGETYAAVRDARADADGDPVVVVNGNDTADVPRPDRLLLAGAPLAVLDGAAAVAARVGAADVVVAVNERDAALQRHLRAAVEAADLPVEPQLVGAPDAFRAEEPTATLEALEGADRVEPRLQPPTPAEHGLYGRPTVVHTPRTLVQVRRSLTRPGEYGRGRADADADADADATDAVGPADPGTRLFTVAGDVEARATVELGSDDALADARDAVRTSGALKTAVVGGRLGGFARDLDVEATARALRAARLGADGVIELYDERRCVLAEAGARARHAAEENSGRCVPGREGTVQLAELLRDVYGGDLDADRIRELARVMRQSANCRLGAAAPRPVVTALDEFEPEVRAHADGRCPAGHCTERL